MRKEPIKRTHPKLLSSAAAAQQPDAPDADVEVAGGGRRLWPRGVGVVERVGVVVQEADKSATALSRPRRSQAA